MSLKNLVISSVIGASIGIAGAYMLIKHEVSEVQERLSLSPPVVIVDFPKLALQYPEGATVEEMDQLMIKTNSAILKLQNAGYLVLDSSAIVSAPEDVYLPGDLIE